MRFLYGDLTDFPPQENSLALLSQFVDMSVEVLKLDHEINKNLKSIEEDMFFLNNTINEINSFQEDLLNFIESVISDKSQDDIVCVIAQGSADSLKRFVEEGKSRVRIKIEQRVKQTESEMNWRKRIHHIYFYTSDGGCIYDHSFKLSDFFSCFFKKEILDAIISAKRNKPL